eukprot:COSAG02_NODE_6737_length_3393_cov_7.207954_1_plen_54_part_00
MNVQEIHLVSLIEVLDHSLMFLEVHFTGTNTVRCNHYTGNKKFPTRGVQKKFP